MTEHLRATPRQQRSLAKVETLLRAAEDVFEQVGFEQATTAAVAEEARVPIGTLYRWFPDKRALAHELCERYVDDIERRYGELITQAADEPIAVLVRRVLDGLEELATERRALGAIASTSGGLGGLEGAGGRLREVLSAQVRTLLKLRVEGIDEASAAVAADGIVTVATAFLVRAGERPAGDRPALFDQLGDFVIAYLEAKFPEPDSPLWQQDGLPVEPLLPGVRWPRPSSASAS